MAAAPQNETSEVALEDRLRGLILNSTQAHPAFQQAPQAGPHGLIPSHFASNKAKNSLPTQQNTSTVSLPTPESPVQSPMGVKKRLNQAQRRQMSSQLSIPVDARPSVQGQQSGRGFSSTGFGPSPRHSGPHSGYHNTSTDETRLLQNQYSSRFQNQPPAFPYHSSQGHFQQHAPQLPHHQMHMSPQTQQGYQYPPGLPPPAHSLGSTQWRGSEQYGPQHSGQFSSSPHSQSSQLYQPGPYNGSKHNLPWSNPEHVARQSSYLESLLHERIPKVGIDAAEVAIKEEFRLVIEQICRDAIGKYEQQTNPNFDLGSVHLKCFGSMASGFATKASDMDLALLSPYSHPAPDESESSIPRILEKSLLENGYGARLLTRTRVPIIKLCQRPTLKLMSDLLEERNKWEIGFTTKEMETHSADILSEVVTNEGEAVRDSTTSEKGSEDGALLCKTPADLYAEQLNSFRQKSDQSLGDYYGSAKRLLHKLGGRDIPPLKLTDNPKEFTILQDVCKAFLRGLSDDILRTRLSTYASLSFPPGTQPGKIRSLSGVFSQVEGELLTMKWKNDSLSEKNQFEIESSQEITRWQELQNQTDFDTIMYNKMLHNALDRLKRIPSLQLHFLEQALHEDPSQYYVRAANILHNLGGTDTPNTGNWILSLVISQYIAGVRDSKARETLERISSHHRFLSLKSLVFHHRVLQLAQDYETALSGSLYNEEDRKDIEHYIGILRDGIKKAATTLQDSLAPPNPLLPMTSSTASIIAKLQSLPNPGHVFKAKDRYSDHLEFRSEDNIGIQCDINFSAQLALHNTLLLKCYSLTDVRVKPMVLFVKHWAKTRAINTPYRGTLSSYGYVLMVLHYLTNVASPFVCPNLQHLSRKTVGSQSAQAAAQTTSNGCDVQFWRNEKEISDLAGRGLLNHNNDSVGTLLRGFFEYYAHNGAMSTNHGKHGFDWMRDVLSLRTVEGLLTKQEKGWVGARTVIETTTEAAPAPPSTHTAAQSTVESSPRAPTEQSGTSSGAVIGRKFVAKEETKEIRHRYLFAIEDPFELDHNVARTVTHNGIVSIRDEFRRAWRIIKAQGTRFQHQQEGLLDEVPDAEAKKGGLKQLLEEIHGTAVFDEDGKEVGTMLKGLLVKPVSTSEIM